MPEADQPKIIVDSDWKAQAQAEKQRLAEKAEPKRDAGPAGAPAGDEPAGPGRAAGPIGFEDLLKMLATQALMYMGAFPDPETGRAVVALDIAKLHIDLLGVLEAKTKGNLTKDESEAMAAYLYELRMQYLEISKALAKAVQEGRISPNAGMGMSAGAAPGVARAHPGTGGTPTDPGST